MTLLTSHTPFTMNLIGEFSTSGSLEIQHVTTLQTDVSVLVLMFWPKIPRWRLFMRIDRHAVARVQGDRSILHSTPTFELPSVHMVPTKMRFCIAAALCTISCGGCISRCHLSSLTPVASIVYLHPWSARWQHTDQSNVVHHWLTLVLDEIFLHTVQLYGMVGHYSQRLPLVHCDIPSHFSLEERLFWYKCTAEHGLLPSRTTLTKWLISKPLLGYYQLLQRHLVSCIHTMLAELPHNACTFVIHSHIYKKNIIAMTYAPHSCIWLD